MLEMFNTASRPFFSSTQTIGLVDKEMVFSIETMEKTAYRVYNVFLMRWLERVF